MSGDYKDILKVGDRVICVHEDHYTGMYTPTKGTCGTIVKLSDCDIKVRWDSGTHPGDWWCDYWVVVPSNV